MRVNKLSLNKSITALSLALKYCKNLLSFQYVKDEIISYRHAQMSHIRFFYKQLGSAVSPQNGLYFQGF